MINETSSVMEPQSTWGGDWTEKKLEVFGKYVEAYLTIMNKNRYWQLIYFDAFAGSGNNNKKEASTNNDLLKDLNITQKEHDVYKGAAERVLGITQKGFDFYYFVDKNKKAIKELEEKLKSKYSDKKLFFRNSDANDEIKKLTQSIQKNKNLKALVLLDPFGMQVDWASIETFKGFSGVDLWILIPTGVIVNRLLDKNGELEYINKLASFFGLDERSIRKYFYIEEQDLFGESIISKVSKPIHKIAELYIARLKEIFSEVIDKPLEMRNDKNVPIYHFVFASNNKTAKKIAKDIIGKF
ncbi:MAG: three-Cys-motif partner protein TcmP [Endomicrobia bacterium]|nr:three-Cys-motif partner protein TcmP [Endomicrobiia bacterium]